MADLSKVEMKTVPQTVSIIIMSVQLHRDAQIPLERPQLHKDKDRWVRLSLRQVCELRLHVDLFVQFRYV